MEKNLLVLGQYQQSNELAEPDTGKRTVQSDGLKWKQAVLADLPMVDNMIEKWKKRYNKLVRSKDA